MEQTVINIYLPPEVDTTGYPDSLLGDLNMSVDYRIESSWMFFLMLGNEGLPVRICREYPRKGILMIHKAFVRKFVWNPDLFVVSMQWDYKRDDRAQVHLVSNEYKTRNSSLGRMDRFSFPGLQYFVQPPMHPDLISRDPNRGDRFENVAFIGAEKNLAEEFRSESFRNGLTELGVELLIVNDPDKMADYSNLDAVLAVRKLGRVVSQKPAQKLINAWRAGVPTILGCEIGYRELKHSNLDYLEVDSPEEAHNAVKRLRDDLDFRHAMVENGRLKAESYSMENVKHRWCELFREQIIPSFAAWCNQSSGRRVYFLFLRRARYILRVSLSFIWHRILGFQARY